MTRIFQTYYTTVNNLKRLNGIPLLLIRLILAYGFYGPAKMKWADIGSITEWFQQLKIPAPELNAYLAASTEAAGVALLLLGLATRIISIPLIVTMLVAIKTVHWSNGFDAGNNGFEIPLYYLLMLFLLLVYGGGKYSVDHLIYRQFKLAADQDHHRQ